MTLWAQSFQLEHRALCDVVQGLGFRQFYYWPATSKAPAGDQQSGDVLPAIFRTIQVLEAREELSLVCFYSDCKVSEGCRASCFRELTGSGPCRAGSGYHLKLSWARTTSEIASRWSIATGSSSQQLQVFAGRGSSDNFRSCF